MDEKQWALTDAAVAQAAVRVVAELQQLVTRLPAEAAPQMAMGLLSVAIQEREPILWGWLEPENAPLVQRPRPQLIVDNDKSEDELF